MRPRLIPAALLTSLVLAVAPSAYAAEDVKILVLKERGVGTSTQAQPFVDKLVEIAKKKLGWAAAKGSYFTERKAAEAYMESNKPQFGILSLAAYLALKDSRKLDTIGQVNVSRAGGQQYFLVSKSGSDAGACKGEKLSTDHADDVKFVERIVFGGTMKLSDFKLDATKRPLQGIKAVIKGDSKCALIDDAQWNEVKNVEGGKELKQVWSSAKLPPLAVVALPSASDKMKKDFKNALDKICVDDGKTVCKEIGIESMKPASDQDYAQILAAYKKDK
jgi:hypothetical protein